MTRALGALACAAALWAGLGSTASAAPGNGQIAAIAHGAADRLVSLNADGSGLRTLWAAPADVTLSRPAWSPDGNRIAFTAGNGIDVYDLAAGTVAPVTSGPQDLDPAWTPDGRRIAFRRVALGLAIALSVRPDGSDPRPYGLALALGTTRVTFAPDGLRAAYVVPPALHVAGLDGLGDRLLTTGVRGAPAWSPDSARVAYSAPGADNSLEILALTPPQTAATPVSHHVAGSLDTAPAWSPDGTQVVYVHEESTAELRVSGADGATTRTVIRGTAADPAWQPCTAGVTAACASVAAPTCATPATVTTRAGDPVDLPPPACSDPAGRALAVSVVAGPGHGTLAGSRYTPAPGFSGQDAVSYRASNGVVDSAVVRQPIFVVPRPVAAAQAPAGRAPFLNARRAPTLSRRGRTSLRASCDQDCTLALRLTVRAKGTITSPLRKRELKAGRVVTLKLALRRRPRHRVTSAWIAGTVRDAAGRGRKVKIPVTLPRRPRGRAARRPAPEWSAGSAA